MRSRRSIVVAQADSRSPLESRLESLLIDQGQRLARIEGILDQLDKRVSETNQRLTTMEQHLTALETRLEHKASAGELRFWAAWITVCIGVAATIVPRLLHP
jgi:uncharacterized coiled-coil protein SlyX